MVRRRFVMLMIMCGVLTVASCATVGKRFPTEQVRRIEIGVTTREDVRVMFGIPWRTGIDSGQETWTFGFYKYRLFGETDTTDLVIRFRDTGAVDSYTFNTTETPLE